MYTRQCALNVTARDLAVIFVRTQKGADNLVETLRSVGLRATTIHGVMSQPERLRHPAARAGLPTARGTIDGNNCAAGVHDDPP